VKALVWHGKEDLRYEDVPEPFPKPGQVKVQVHFTGICGTDVHEYQGGPIFINTDKPNLLTGQVAPPMTLGHEFSGTVVESGEGVTSFKVGDRVGADALWYCGKCYFCMRGMPNQCLHVAFTGCQANGSMAEYVVVPAYSLYKLPDSISDEIGALLEPLAVGLHAVRRGMISAGDTVAILGGGPIGLSVLLAARACAASKIYVLEISEPRSQKALAMGATAAINPKDVDPVAKIKELTGGLGADISFECIGSPDTFPLAIELSRDCGTTVILGMATGPTTNFSFLHLWLGQKTVTTSLAYVHEAATCIELIADGRIEPGKMISDKVPLKDAVEKGFKELVNNPEKHCKILLESP